MNHAVVVATGERPPETRPDGPREIVVPRQQPWAEAYPFSSHWLGLPRAAGGRTWLHFVDEGPRDAPVIVFLHGNPTWSWYWRHLIVALRERYRCIAVDHLGMGLSDRPQDDDSYRLAGHVDRVQALLTALGIQRYRLVGHDWGGCIAAGVATREPARVDGLVWMNTAAFRSTFIPWSIAVCRIPGLGALAVRGLNAFAGVATLRATKKHERLRGAVRQGYLAPYGNWHDRIATHRFVLDIPRDPSHPSWGELLSIEQNLSTLKDKPIALFWGDADFCFTPAFRKRFEAEFPAAAVHAWADCGHYVAEDARERIDPLVRDFMARVDALTGVSASKASSATTADTSASKAA
jgi:pimeloyl-ACP methyl ester carboxylesterase